MAYTWMQVACCEQQWDYAGGPYGKNDAMPAKYRHAWGAAYTDRTGIVRAPTKDIHDSWYCCYTSGHPSAIELIQGRLNVKRNSIINAGGNIANVPAPLVEDGVWGDKTREMVRWVQGRSSGLTIDGIVGEKTWNAIK